MADAQKHAEFLANSNRFEATTMGKYGCNIAMSVRADKAEAVKESIQRVYDSNNYFNFLNPQVAHMGVGVARNGYENRWVIVCFYGTFSADKAKWLIIENDFFLLVLTSFHGLQMRRECVSEVDSEEDFETQKMLQCHRNCSGFFKILDASLYFLHKF